METTLQKMSIKVDFSGGAEIMFGGKREIILEMSYEATKDLILEDVIEELRVNHLKEKEELFI